MNSAQDVEEEFAARLSILNAYFNVKTVQVSFFPTHTFYLKHQHWKEREKDQSRNVRAKKLYLFSF